MAVPDASLNHSSGADAPGGAEPSGNRDAGENDHGDSNGMIETNNNSPTTSPNNRVATDRLGNEAQKENAKGKEFVRSRPNVLNCLICERKCKDEDKLREHFLKHAGESRECFMCEREFESTRLMQEHFCEAHGGFDKFECQYCNKRFYLKRLFNSHLSQKHPASLEVTIN